MNPAVKICGISDAASLDAAVKAGAAYLGFVFYPPSPRALHTEAAQRLAQRVPAHIMNVGLFVDPTNEELLSVTRHIPFGLIQLHGKETPQRTAEIRRLTGMAVMKSFSVAAAEDLTLVTSYDEVADMFLFDAAPRPNASLPGGNGESFNWALLKGKEFKKPWMLAGGLTAANLAEAVFQSGASIVDVSSGVEDAPAHKNVDKIREFLGNAKQL